jgi:predicted SprT family Zn-dependent metalloprotease
MYDTIDEIKTLVFETFAILADYSDSRCYEVKINFNNRITRTMGKANGHRIQLSAKLWPHIDEDLKREIIIHEACHVVQKWAFPFSQSHGPEWSKLMRLNGLKPRATYPMPEDLINKVKPKSQHRKKAFCGCKDGCIVGPRQYTRIKNRTHKYCCMICRERISATPLLKLKGGGIWDDVATELEKLLQCKSGKN